MTVSWNADMDQRLLMAVLAVVKLDTAAVEEKWKELFKFDNITQPTKRAIVEHIAKLKKAIGISGGKPPGPGSSPPLKPKSKGVGKSGRKPKPDLKISSLSKGEDRDGIEKPIDVKDEQMESPTRRSTSSTPSPKSKGKPQAKRRLGSMSDDESSDDGVISIKSEDDEFRGPRIDDQTPSPTRSQAPRRAKTERKVSWVELSSSDEEDYEEDGAKDSSIDEESNIGDDPSEDAQGEAGEHDGEDQAVPDTQLVSDESSIMVIG